MMRIRVFHAKVSIYDADGNNVVENIKQLKIKTTTLFSNPCIELWFLLHYQNQTAEISTNNCINELKKNYKDYQKGNLSTKIKAYLSNYNEAYNRAKKLNYDNNPSTDIYKLIDIFNNLAKL